MRARPVLVPLLTATMCGAHDAAGCSVVCGHLCIMRIHGEWGCCATRAAVMAVQGGSVGHTFEQLAYIIEHVGDKSRVGVCLDTCHMFAAGYVLSPLERQIQAAGG